MAVAGAASAQVTLSGAYGFGFVSDETNLGVATTGLSVTDGHFTLTATEDLGGGMKLTAKAEMLNRGRDTAISARDASMTLSGGFGALTMGSVESGNPVQAYSGGNGRDAGALQGAGNVDLLLYTLPEMVTGLSVSLSKADPTGAGAVGTGNSTGVSATYAAGPLTVGAGVTNFKAGHSLNWDSRTTMGVKYDLGMAVVSYGTQTYKYMAAAANTNDRKETVFGITAPVASNISVGLTSRKMSQVGTNNVRGTDIGATYMLSKRTKVNVSSESIKTVGTAASAKYNRIKLVHSF